MLLALKLLLFLVGGCGIGMGIIIALVVFFSILTPLNDAWEFSSSAARGKYPDRIESALRYVETIQKKNAIARHKTWKKQRRSS